MNYIEFQKILGEFPVIDIRNAVTYFNGLDRRRLYEWQKKGYIRKIANGFYLFADRDVDEDLLRAAAAVIYEPSYIGLESALAYYGFIPEAVFQMISLTTRRNKVFRTPVGDFRYHTIKREYFFGYQAVRSEAGWFLISDPEKTLLDTLYFLPSGDRKDVLTELRLNIPAMRGMFDFEKMSGYLTVFASPKLDRGFKLLKEMIDDSP